MLTTKTTSCAGPPSWRTDVAADSAESPTRKPRPSSCSVAGSPAFVASALLPKTDLSTQMLPSAEVEMVVLPPMYASQPSAVLGSTSFSTPAAAARPGARADRTTIRASAMRGTRRGRGYAVARGMASCFRRRGLDTSPR